MNLKLRFQNKVTLTSMIVLIISLAYKVLTIFNVIPSVSEQEIVDIASIAIDILCLIGIVNDPTTTGITDSARAMSYTEPSDIK